MARKKKPAAQPTKKPKPKTVKLDTIAPPLAIIPQKAEAKPVTIAVPSKKGTASSAVEKATTSGVVKKAELIDHAVEKCGLKKRDVKPSIEAALEVLAEALIKGEELHLPPLGKLRVVKSKDVKDGVKVLTLKLRTMKDGAGQGGGAQKDASEAAPTTKPEPSSH